MTRRKSDVLVNVITVHNYGMSGDNESDTDSIPEQQILIIEEETTNNELSINDDKIDVQHVQCKIVLSS